ncbi:hypothetical protein M011DRAFT_485187 [Sporormia fimetaria CBS 119925]|uniref:Uncharacterized protein n=1 Tax=Sporormia fimetaria CBS 119925 TaxID=1340428 RepID=A0A6A6VFX3_9PLEO|nr:hypothetical protein M011DRAFT_485187 [Sporormia fimetaria CBS 119925]
MFRFRRKSKISYQDTDKDHASKSGGLIQIQEVETTRSTRASSRTRAEHSRTRAEQSRSRTRAEPQLKSKLTRGATFDDFLNPSQMSTWDRLDTENVERRGSLRRRTTRAKAKAKSLYKSEVIVADYKREMIRQWLKSVRANETELKSVDGSGLKSVDGAEQEYQQDLPSLKRKAVEQGRREDGK